MALRNWSIVYPFGHSCIDSAGDDEMIKPLRTLAKAVLAFLTNSVFLLIIIVGAGRRFGIGIAILGWFGTYILFINELVNFVKQVMNMKTRTVEIIAKRPTGRQYRRQWIENYITKNGKKVPGYWRKIEV